MMNDIGSDKKQQRYISKKMINIAIRATYYIFCFRKRDWDSPDLMQFRIFLGGGEGGFCFCFVFVFFFFFIIQSQAAFVNYLYVARFTIVHSKTQIKFPLLLFLDDKTSFISEEYLGEARGGGGVINFLSLKEGLLRREEA